MTDLRYPIGKFAAPERVDEAARAAWIEEVERAPALIRAAVEGLDNAQLDTPYREGGWTVRQTVHHLADSHMNSYVRFRLALTEDRPAIKPYDEKRWAELPDSRTADVAISLALLDAMHARWAMLLRSMSEADFARAMVHPERGTVDLGHTLGIYAWHGRHHAAQITGLRGRMGW